MDEPYEIELGPFYDTDGEEIMPSGYDEAFERLLDTLGLYQVRSNVDCFPSELRVLPTDLTAYIQAEWNRLFGGDPANPPRRGFLMSSRSASHAAGRAAEEIVLEKLLPSLRVSGQCGQMHRFYDALDKGMIIKPRGIGSDDYLVFFRDGRCVVVESKASFRQSVNRYLEKASRQLAATCQANEAASHILLAMTDLSRKSIELLLLDRSEFEAEPHDALRRARAELSPG